MAASEPEAKKAVGRCPICGKPSAQATRPFCSSQCRDIDLGRWVSGSYVITAGDDDSDEDGKLPGSADGVRPPGESDSSD